ncbi:MAG TPA: NAD-dependent epimerase [Fulvivirga sp.]|nr:NAD-dependent epimerase [Fulvivirga sp.]
MAKILVTGAAGFIGFHLCKTLSERGDTIVGLDNISGYYDISLKLARLKELGINQHEISEGVKSKSNNFKNFSFIKADIKDKNVIDKLFENEKFDSVANLAAQAGVRYSVENPQVYIDANIQGFINILEACRNHPVKHLVFASSSSVYGANTKMPFSVTHNVDHPLSLYAATKKSNELMAHAYSHLFNIPVTGLRFFTVYGPWGRPDMALFLFSDAIANDKPIKVFNKGDMARDFTYIDDIVDGVIKVLDKPAAPDLNWDSENPNPATSKAPYRIYNIGKNKPVKLMDFIQTLENEFGKVAKKDFLPIQAGDVPSTFANVNELIEDLDFQPVTDIKKGIKAFVEWYNLYYNLS